MESNTKLNINQKYNLITRNLAESIGSEENIKKILSERSLRIYWGTAPTGRIHIGYFIPILKLADYLAADCEVTILLADLHAYLDSLKSPWDLLNLRTKYYELMIKSMLESMGVNISKLKFVKGTDYQLSKPYIIDMFKLNSLTKLSDAKNAGAEVVKQSKDPLMTGLLYPGLQVLDEEYLNVDAQTGGIDQRKIFMMSREFIQKLGYIKRFHFMTPMMGPLKGKPDDNDYCEDNNNNDNNNNHQNINKMSSSDDKGKIDLLDGKNAIKKKINAAYCLPGDIKNNSILELLKMVIFPFLNHKEKDFIIDRKEEYGGSITYKNYEQVEIDFQEEKLHPGDLKLGVIDNLNIILEPIRNIFNQKDNIKLVKDAYSTKNRNTNNNSNINVSKRQLKKEMKRKMKIEKKQQIKNINVE